MSLSQIAAFDKDAADRIDEVIRKYPMDLSTLAAIAELMGPMCNLFSPEGAVRWLDDKSKEWREIANEGLHELFFKRKEFTK